MISVRFQLANEDVCDIHIMCAHVHMHAHACTDAIACDYVCVHACVRACMHV